MRYGSLVALNGIGFECREGEFFTLLGPSGAGKTTTLELIAGIRSPDKGEIYIGDRLVNGLPPYERNVAMAFENYALYPHFTVYENIAFPLRSRRREETLSNAQERERIEEITQLLGINRLLKRNPQQLSGGEKQRVSLARAMIRKPDVYLLDEPIAHLDAKLKVSARSTLKQLADRLGTTILYVTHDFREALGLSDHILVLRKGNIEQIGSPQEIYGSPASDFVARLVGDPPINLVDGEVKSEDGSVFFRSGRHLQFPVRKDLVKEMEKAVWQEGDRKKVRIGIRPKNVLISPEKPSVSSFSLPVYAIVREAESSLITFELENTFFLVKVDSRVDYKVSENVWIDVDQDCLYFFRKSVELTK